MLLGRRGNYFQGDGEINTLFSGIKGAQSPPPPGGASEPLSVEPLGAPGIKYTHTQTINTPSPVLVTAKEKPQSYTAQLKFSTDFDMMPHLE